MRSKRAGNQSVVSRWATQRKPPRPSRTDDEPTRLRGSVGKRRRAGWLLVSLVLALSAVSLDTESALPESAGNSVIVHVGTLLQPGGYWGVAFARKTPYAYANSSRGVDVIDVADPTRPSVVATIAAPHSYMEDINLGERPDGTTFVLIQTPEILQVVDVTDPKHPRLRGRLPVSAHTWTCLTPRCTYAYSPSESTATGPATPVIDLRDLDAPAEVAAPLSRVAFGHDWNRDESAVMWHVGQGGIVAYDTTVPTSPAPLNASVPRSALLASAEWARYNDRSHLHGSLRPNADQFQPGNPPSTGSGNVLFVSEEGNNVDCTDGFQTWEVPSLDASFIAEYDPADATITNGSIKPLDYWSLAEDEEISPDGRLCSVHWFDFHHAGFVVIPTYHHGTRVLDVRDPRRIRQVASVHTPGNNAFASYWVPQRSPSGVATGQLSQIVYTADASRGIDVFHVQFPN